LTHWIFSELLTTAQMRAGRHRRETTAKRLEFDRVELDALAFFFPKRPPRLVRSETASSPRPRR
jgi:hypothetical protein